MFLSEHCLSFSMAESLISFAQRVSKNTVALDSVSLSSTSATYTTCHGVAQHFKNKLAEKLNGKFFSLNVDEATSAAGKKILNILVQHYDEDEQKVVVDLLGSREVNQAKAVNLLGAVESVLVENSLTWDQVISVLMDNCAVMRGVKGGLEAKMREKNESLLDINGDTVHIVNNAAKKVFTQIEQDVFPFQSLASDIYYDIEDSPKVKDLFSQLQDFLYCKALSIVRPITTRFLQLKSVADRLVEVWDALLLYYTSFMLPAEESKRKKIRDEIFQKYELDDDKRQKVMEILNSQRKDTKKGASLDRKMRIINLMIDNGTKCFAIIQLHRGLLNTFQGYVKNFQSAKPQCHRLHCEMFDLVKAYFSFFIKSEHIPVAGAKELSKIDVTDRNLQVNDRSLYVGEFCLPIMMKCLRDKDNSTWLPSFFTALRQGYIEGAKLLKKLPITNETLTRLSYLDPCNQRSSLTSSVFLQLAEKLPNVIKPEELGKLDLEARTYTTDDVITMLDTDSEDDAFRLDENWWKPIFAMKSRGETKYPYLARLVKALLSIFSGPLVEGTFNIMHDIIEEDRARLTQFNYEAIAVTKTFLHARNLKSTNYSIPKEMIREITKSYENYSAHLAKKKELSKSASTSMSTTTTTSKASSNSNPFPKTPRPNNPSTNNTSTKTSDSISATKKRKQVSLVDMFSKKPKTS